MKLLISVTKKLTYLLFGLLFITFIFRFINTDISYYLFRINIVLIIIVIILSIIGIIGNRRKLKNGRSKD